MLDIIRKNARSWGIKIIFIMIVVVFVFWGVGNFKNEKMQVIAYVNSRPITIQSFMNAYQQSLDAFRRQNPNITEDDLKRINFKENVLNGLIDTELLRAMAADTGISVSADELRAEIGKIPAFWDDNREIDPEKYKAVLTANRITPADFETEYKNELLLKKLTEVTKAPSVISTAQAREIYNYLKEKAKIDYIIFDFGSYLDKTQVTDAEIEKYYKDKPDQFVEPAGIRIEYLQLSPRNLAGKHTATDEEIKKYYESNKKQYEHADIARASHIIIMPGEKATQKDEEAAKEKIEKIAQDLKKGADFEKLARQYSEDGSKDKGGDLGWFTREDMIKEFSDKAFNMKPGEISEPFKTKFGWHIVKVTGRKAAGTTPLDEVKDEIRQKILTTKANAGIGDALDKAIDAVNSGKSLNATAAQLGLAVNATDFFTKNQAPKELPALSPDALTTLFALPKDGITDTPITLEDGYLLARKIEERPAAPKPLEKVKSRIIEILKQEKAKTAAKNDADALAAELKDPNKAKTALEKYKDKIKTSEPFSRDGFIPGLGPIAKLGQLSTSAKPGAWIPEAFETPRGYVIASLKERIPVAEQAWLAEKDKWMIQLSQSRQRELFQTMLTALKQKAKIEIIASDILK